MSTSDVSSSKALPALATMLVVACVALALSTLRAAPAPVEMGDRVDASVTLALESGDVVYDERLTLTLKEGALVQGLLDTIVGMAPGTETTATIPPERAYGPRGRGDIPPNATLTANVTLHSVTDRAD